MVKKLLAALTIAFTSCQHPAAIPDVTTASESELQMHLGRRISFRGRLFLNGKQGPFALLGDRPIYLNDYRNDSAADSWRAAWLRMDGATVRVTGVLRFMHSPQGLSRDEPISAPSSHFFLDEGAIVSPLPR